YLVTNGLFFSENEVQGSDLMSIISRPTCILIADVGDWEAYTSIMTISSEMYYSFIINLEEIESNKPDHINYLPQAPYATVKDLKFCKLSLMQGMCEELQIYLAEFEY
ncbi:hypothetical protein GGF44_004129, partial [Coemansia sp. RSA 1694]